MALISVTRLRVRFFIYVPQFFLIQHGGYQVDRLVRVIGRCMIAIREPVLKDFLLGRAQFEADGCFDCGHTFLDEAVLIAADESIA